MGSVKRDLVKREKQLELLYPMDQPEGVQALLDNIHHVRESRFANGDFDACILLLDFLQAYEEAGLTPRQKEILDLVFEQDLTQGKVAQTVGIAQPSVCQHIEYAIRKIAAQGGKAS